jgi:polar amino acid transport system substrate-binding protein
MQSGRYDFIAAPTTVTKERAENMLFTAGYLWTAYQFGIKKGSAPIKDWADLKGKSVAVNKGTPYETLQENGPEHGFRCRLRHPADATQAVLRPRLRHLGGNTSIVYTAPKNPQFVADLELKDTRAHWAAPVPRQSQAGAELQDALDCMKKDGTSPSIPRSGSTRSPADDSGGSRGLRRAGMPATTRRRTSCIAADAMTPTSRRPTSTSAPFMS